MFEAVVRLVARGENSPSYVWPRTVEQNDEIVMVLEHAIFCIISFYQRVYMYSYMYIN